MTSSTWHVEEFESAVALPQMLEKLKSAPGLNATYGWHQRESVHFEWLLGRRPDGVTVRIRALPQPSRFEVEAEVPPSMTSDDREATKLAEDAVATAKRGLGVG